MMYYTPLWKTRKKFPNLDTVKRIKNAIFSADKLRKYAKKRQDALIHQDFHNGDALI